MSLSFFLHLLGLTVPGFWLGQRLRLSAPLCVGLSFLVFETSVIFGAGMLSWAGILGHLAVYQFVTTLVAFAISLGLWLVAQHDGTFPVKSRSIVATKRATSSRLISVVNIAMLVAFAAVMLYVALSNYPLVEDSLTVKLPKIVFAIEANSILPTNLTDESRMYISPVYPALVQLFLVINGQNGHALLVFGFVNWIVCGFAVSQLCRDLGSSTAASWIVTTLVLLSPALIVQGSSEGDDLLAATPLMIALTFLSAWLQRGGYLYPILAGLGLGFAVGFKFLALFFVPALPIVLLFAVIRYPRSQVLSWIRERWSGALAICAGFVVALTPHFIANWMAFGNPLYVSTAVAATRNASLDCGLRNVVGYTKNLLFSDFTHLLLSPLYESAYAAYETAYASVRDQLNHVLPPLVAWMRDHLVHTRLLWRLAKYLPDLPDVMFRANAGSLDRMRLLAEADSYDKFVREILPYNPTVGCSAYAQSYLATRNYITDNTLWYGAFGPLLLISAFVAALSRHRPLLLRALGVGFLIWVIAFALSQKYLWDIGRYWSVAVLAGSPTVAILIDRAWRRGIVALALRSLIVLAGAVTVLLGMTVLSTNGHRATSRDGNSRYVNGFSPELRALLKAAPAVNVRTAYGMDTYDYYMLMDKGAKLTNLATIRPDMLNVVIVRPAGMNENIYSDPRIPVRMKHPFAGGFGYFGKALPQPGYYFSLAFANHLEATGQADLGKKSVFLLFEPNVRVEKSRIVGTIQQVADDATAGRVRFKIGWRGPDGSLTMNDDWHRGRSTDLEIPEQATAIVVQAVLDDGDNEGMAEWPIRGFDPKIVTALDKELKLGD